MISVMLIDNFDSFSFNLVDALTLLGAKVSVFRNTVPFARAQRWIADTETRLVVLSPGPGAPKDAGVCLEMAERLAGRVPMLGICLGHQCMVEAAGGTIERIGVPVHGKAWVLEHDGRGIFAGISRPTKVGRYHSLATRHAPAGFHTQARAQDLVMAMTDPARLQVGLQFHPESFLTPHGQRLLENVLRFFKIGGEACAA